MATGVTTVYPERGLALCIWPALGVAENGDMVSVARWHDKTVTAQGTFGGATVTIEGSNDGVVWHICQDFLGGAATFTVNGMKVLASNPQYMRAITTGGAGTGVVVSILGKKD